MHIPEKERDTFDIALKICCAAVTCVIVLRPQTQTKKSINATVENRNSSIILDMVTYIPAKDRNTADFAFKTYSESTLVISRRQARPPLPPQRCCRQPGAASCTLRAFAGAPRACRPR